MIPIFKPYFAKNEKKYIDQCIKTRWISSQGDFILRFERNLAKYHSMKYCVVTSNCTTALHLSLKALNIKKGDEVICPALTFIAPANMIALSGASLVLVDVDKETLTIDPAKIEERITKKTRAIIVVHQFGHSAHMSAIKKIAIKHRLKIIEDNAESLGGKYRQKLLGTIGDITTLSFFANKIITTGEGGALLTNNKKVAEKAMILRDHGMSKKKKYQHTDLGYNYRMTNMQAAIGLAQLEYLNKINKIRLDQMKTYYELLGKEKNIELRKFKDWTSPVHWLLTLRIKNKSRTKAINYMMKNGIECREMIKPVFKANHFSKNFIHDQFKVSQNISKNYFHLPSSTDLTKKEIKFITDHLIKFCKN